MQGRPGRNPCRGKLAEPLIGIQSQRVERKCDAAAGQQRDQNRHYQPMGIVGGRDAEAAIVAAERKPALDPLRAGKHVAVAERDQLRIAGRT